MFGRSLGSPESFIHISLSFPQEQLFQVGTQDIGWWTGLTNTSRGTMIGQIQKITNLTVSWKMNNILKYWSLCMLYVHEFLCSKTFELGHVMVRPVLMVPTILLIGLKVEKLAMDGSLWLGSPNISYIYCRVYASNIPQNLWTSSPFHGFMMAYPRKEGKWEFLGNMFMFQWSAYCLVGIVDIFHFFAVSLLSNSCTYVYVYIYICQNDSSLEGSAGLSVV